MTGAPGVFRISGSRRWSVARNSVSGSGGVFDFTRDYIVFGFDFPLRELARYAMPVLRQAQDAISPMWPNKWRLIGWLCGVSAFVRVYFAPSERAGGYFRAFILLRGLHPRNRSLGRSPQWRLDMAENLVGLSNVKDKQCEDGR